MDNEKLLARVASIICAETCGLTSECKSRAAASALFDQGYLFGGVSDGSVQAAVAKAADLGLSVRPDDLKAILQSAFQ